MKGLMYMELGAFEIILFSAVFFVGMGATGVYYFARYYFKTSEDDPEVVAGRAIDMTNVLARESSAAPDLTKKAEAPPAEAPLTPPKSIHSALEKTRATLWGRLKDAFSGKGLAGDELESLEEILYTSDLGPSTVQRLLDAVEEKLPGSQKAELERVREALKQEMLSIFNSLPDGQDREVVSITRDPVVELASRLPKPQVWMIVGVNGAGKTTTIGKLAYRAARSGLKVMVVAGDTFRAAAGEQLKIWSDRAQVEIFSPPQVNDPSAVVFDGLNSGKAKGFDLLIVDTAGRLHTQDNLMEELKKMKRVADKVMPGSPHETFIVLDSNSGQNALVQARMFHQALSLTGAVLTKLDGSAKGGVALGLAHELGLPIKLIGVGEGIDDLRPFDSKEFVDSIL